MPDFFGQFGKITKVVINRRPIPNGPPNSVSFGVYVTYARKEDAARAIEMVDMTTCEGRMVR
jgi:CCR4-NOT transcription complex subunit 4